MLGELGLFALILALCVAILQAGLPLLGVVCHNTHWQLVSRPLAHTQTLFVAISFVILVIAFLIHDFSIQYVANNSTLSLPWYYRLVAVWGSHEGSMLLWILMLVGWTSAVAICSRQLPNDVLALVLAVLAMLSIGFLLFLLFTSNPFVRLFPVPADGLDLNPLLQDPGVIIHPPMLYMGYVGFAIAFAFAIAVLLKGHIEAKWVAWLRLWTLLAWSFLTLGIMLGSWWAYRVLGWGGWWFWDPVENASFLPWLTGTALIHSLIVTEKRHAFKGWTVFLAIATFSLSLIGTFIVRSGVLTSVHAFALDPARGLYILIFLIVAIGCALILYAWRAARLQHHVVIHLLSRETLLLLNNVLLIVAMLTILLGTLYPLLIDALGMGKLSVGPPYFNAVFIPLMVPLLFVMGFGPNCYWQRMSLMELLRRLKLVIVLSLAFGLGLPWLVAGAFNTIVSLGLTLGGWIIFATFNYVYQHTNQFKRSMSRNHWGMVIAHIGLALVVISVTLTSMYRIDRDVLMDIGDSINIHHYRFEMLTEYDTTGANYLVKAVDFAIYQDEQLIDQLTAEKRLYTVTQMPLTQPAINITTWRDLYIALGEPIGATAWAVRIYYKPFVRWMWAGGLLMVLGGIVAIRRRE